MAKLKEKDFVEIDYIGRIKESNQVFDLTNEEIAKKEEIYNKDAKYGARTICLGENQILNIIDSSLIGKEEGENYTLEIKPEDGFGKKDAKLIKIIPLQALRNQNINPFPGLQIQASGLMGTIRSVAGGRVTVDFNHPLAGKVLLYEIKINKIIESNDQKLKSLIENMFGISEKEYDLKIESNKASIKIKPVIPSKAKDELKLKAQQLIPSLEIAFS